MMVDQRCIVFPANSVDKGSPNAERKHSILGLRLPQKCKSIHILFFVFPSKKGIPEFSLAFFLHLFQSEYKHKSIFS